MIVAGYTSINAVVKAELFPTTVRATGVGLPYAVDGLDLRRHGGDRSPSGSSRSATRPGSTTI
ncbi:MAG: hypothetical protein QM736_14265 [Vicinamibacterales bacterium]